VSQIVGAIVLLIGVLLGVFLVLHGLGVFPGLAANAEGDNAALFYSLGLVFSVILIGTGMTAIRKGTP